MALQAVGSDDANHVPSENVLAAMNMNKGTARELLMRSLPVPDAQRMRALDAMLGAGQRCGTQASAQL